MDNKGKTQNRPNCLPLVNQEVCRYWSRIYLCAKELNAIPYDIPGAEYTHEGAYCTFDYIVKKHQLTDPAIQQIATIVRGADTDSFQLAPQAAGLWLYQQGYRTITKTTMKC